MVPAPQHMMISEIEQLTQGNNPSDECLVKIDDPSSEAEGKTQEEATSGLQVSEEDDDSNEDDTMYEGNNVPSSQQFGFSQMSQTDEHIRMLEREGELGLVYGSQSILSQELIHSSQSTAQADADEPDFHLSQVSESSTALARRLGLLSQEDKSAAKTEPQVSLPNADAHDPAGPDESVVTDGIVLEDARTPPAATKTPVTDTPFRESECFGSLLEAVEKITREEEMSAKMIAWQHNSVDADPVEEVATTPPRVKGNRRSTSNKRKHMASPVSSSASPSKKSSKPTGTPKKDNEQRKSQDVAKRAALLAEQTITDPEMAKKLLLSMALVRENPRSVPSVLPSKGATVPEGFFWAHYPPLESGTSIAQRVCEGSQFHR